MPGRPPAVLAFADDGDQILLLEGQVERIAIVIVPQRHVDVGRRGGRCRLRLGLGQLEIVERNIALRAIGPARTPPLTIALCTKKTKKRKRKKEEKEEEKRKKKRRRRRQRRKMMKMMKKNKQKKNEVE